MTDTETIPVTFSGSFGTVTLDCPVVRREGGIVHFDTTPLADYLGTPVRPRQMRHGANLMQRVKAMFDFLR